MWPAPWIVLFTLVSPPPKTPITLLGLFDMLSVPPPVSVTAAGTALTTINSVAVPVLLIFRWPPLLMVPPPDAPMERETPLLMRAVLVPAGTPALHLPGLLQFPAPPSHTVVWANAGG